MSERSIQDYLYANPRVLFPTGNITEKAREYSIHGKRIDLLFVVDGVRYIIEIKNVPLQREHIGQVVEYYGLMREYMEDARLEMILVSPSIPSWRAAYLEQLGIRCVEIPEVPITQEEIVRIGKETRKSGKRVTERAEVEASLEPGESMTFEEIACPANPRGLPIAIRVQTESLQRISEVFPKYEIRPFGITRAGTHDFHFEHEPAGNYGSPEFTRGGVWWAYRIGYSRSMDKNDVPNISIIANTTGLDVCINAELLRSQEVMLNQINAQMAEFDQLLAEHGRIWLKTYLKYEHQPRFYHWILAERKCPGEFNGASMLDFRRTHEIAFDKERRRWLACIALGNKELSESQKQHLETKNGRLNLAMRLVETFDRRSSLWSLGFDEQVTEIVGAIRRLEPLIGFFVRET